MPRLKTSVVLDKDLWEATRVYAFENRVDKSDVLDAALSAFLSRGGTQSQPEISAALTDQERRIVDGVLALIRAKSHRVKFIELHIAEWEMLDKPKLQQDAGVKTQDASEGDKWKNRKGSRRPA